MTEIMHINFVSSIDPYIFVDQTIQDLKDEKVKTYYLFNFKYSYYDYETQKYKNIIKENIDIINIFKILINHINLEEIKENSAKYLEKSIEKNHFIHYYNLGPYSDKDITYDGKRQTKEPTTEEKLILVIYYFYKYLKDEMIFNSYKKVPILKFNIVRHKYNTYNMLLEDKDGEFEFIKYIDNSDLFNDNNY